jgi:uncharacterized protein DUF4360
MVASMLHHRAVPLIVAAMCSLLVGCVMPLEPESGPGSVSAEDDGSDASPPEATVAVTMASCPGGQSVSVASTKEIFTVSFDALIAQPGAPFDCAVTARYDFPSGWQLALMHGDVTGSVAADEGAQLEVALTGALDGNATTATDARTGPIQENYVLRQDAAAGAITACGATSAVVEYRLRGTATGGDGFVTIEVLDSRTDWRACP